MLVAALVEVGHGRLTPAQAASILAGGDRARLPEAAPPTGLYLMQCVGRGGGGVLLRERGREGGGTAPRSGRRAAGAAARLTQQQQARPEAM